MLRKNERLEFAICIASRGYDDLEVWKIYRVLPDDKAAEVGCVRVIDDSGEDYLYPARRFVKVDFPKDIRARLPRWRPRNGRNRTLAPARQKASSR